MRPHANQPSMPKPNRKLKKSTRNALLSSLEIGMYFTAIPMNTSKKNPWLMGLGNGSTPGNHFFLEASRTASQWVLTALIPSIISFPPSQLLDFAPLNSIVVLAPLTVARVHRSTIRRLHHWQRGSVKNSLSPFLSLQQPYKC